MLDRAFRLLQSVTQIGADLTDADEKRLRKMVGVLSVVMGGIPLILGYGLLFLWLHETVAGWVLVFGSVLMLIGLLRFSLTRDFAFYNIYWLFITNISSFIASICLGGFQRDGFFTFWGIVVPLIAAITNKLAYAVGWFVLYAIEIIAMLIVNPLLRQKNAIPTATISVLSAINLICFAGYVVGVMLYFVRKQDFLMMVIRDEKARSEALLLNILPKEIADRLKKDERLISDRYPDVSIMFADIVGFTPLSAKMQPTQLVELLNEVFSYFDSLVEEYGLEKIKTIGDCYMVASGVPQHRVDHAQVLVRMALQIQSHMQTHRFGQGIQLSFRIGINSGPVVAGVIGHKKFTYDLWGDAVNTASRMESCGSGGTVQITQTTYDLIARSFICETGGKIQVKGKGEMPVWFVRSEKIAQSLLP